MRVLALLFLTTSSLASAQTYKGDLGLVVSHSAQITVYRSTRSTHYFRGTYSFAPGVTVPMTGQYKAGIFKVDNWFECPAVWTDKAIIGGWVRLFRK